MTRESRPHGSIRRLLTLRLLMILVPMLLVQGGIYYRGYRAQQGMELQLNLESARSVADTFEAYVREVRRDAVAVGEGFVLPPAASPEEESSLLARTVREYPPIRVLSWLDPAGRVRASSAPGVIGADYSRTDWLRAIAAGTREWAVSNATRSPDPGQTTFVIAQGVYNAQGRIEGVMAATVDPAKLPSYLIFTVPRGSTFTLVDASGWVVYRFPKMDIAWRERDWGGRSPAVRAALAGTPRSVVASSLINGALRFIGVAPVRSVGWAAGVGRPESVVTSAVEREVLSDSWVVFAVALLAFLLATAAARRINEPLQHLRWHALAMERGDLHTRVEEISGPAEVVDLAQAFNRMADKLELREHEHERLLEAERERARSGRLLETVTEHTLIALAYLDRDLRYLRVNRAYGRAVGAVPEELIGRPYTERLDTPGVLALLQQACATGEPLEVQDLLYQPDERASLAPQYWDIAVAPVTDEQGEVEGVVISAIDVTARVQAREGMLEAERARVRMAETVAAEINHRMKNNLMLISGLLAIQLSTQPAASPAAEALREAIARMSALSIVHEQMYETRAGDVELKDAMARIARLATSALSRGDIALTITGEPVRVPAKIGSAVSMVANELITNALKYGAPAPDGQIHIDIAVSRPADSLHVSISNSGATLPAGFDASQQRGLGLRLARGVIVDQLGGTFSLRPAAGGTVGEIMLPADSFAGNAPGRPEGEGSEEAAPARDAAM